MLCLLEKEFPPSFFDPMTHLLVHLVEELHICGLVHSRWMYPLERYMKSLKGFVRNKARPEGGMAEGYALEEALGWGSAQSTCKNLHLHGVESGMSTRSQV